MEQPPEKIVLLLGWMGRPWLINQESSCDLILSRKGQAGWRRVGIGRSLGQNVYIAFRTRDSYIAFGPEIIACSLI
jgi:hypothetical protein